MNPRVLVAPLQSCQIRGETSRETGGVFELCLPPVWTGLSDLI